MANLILWEQILVFLSTRLFSSLQALLLCDMIFQLKNMRALSRALLVLCTVVTSATAQNIPFIQADQIAHWKTVDTDTVFVINFWATWCGPCVAELPAFERLNKKYAAQKVKVLLVSTDFKRDVDQKLKAFIKRKKIKSQVVFMNESNPNKWIDLVSPDWSGSIPATLIVSKRKAYERFFEKSLSWEELETAVKAAVER